MRSPISIISLLLHVILSAAESEQCGLSCDHGTCTMATDKQEELSAMVQSGKMIERCTCEEGYGGVACDIRIHPCQSDGKCSNGRACQRSKETGELSCECSDADGVSRFAGLMCRNPYTEYCADKYNPDESTSFCTNGGKCKSSFISAQVAPGNTTINNEYRRLGCVCPKEFDGPHCEFLKYDRQSSPDTSAGGDMDTNANDNPETTNGNEGNIDTPLEPVQGEDPKVENGQPNISMIVGLSCLAAFSIVLVLIGMNRRSGRQQMIPDEMYAASIGHEYPPDYASDTFSYGQTHLYPLDLSQPIAMSGRGSNYSDSPYDIVNTSAAAGAYREEDGLERPSACRSTRRVNPPLYIDFETNTTISDRRYRGYHEDDQAPSDWESRASHNTKQWGNRSECHGYYYQ